MGLEPSLEIRPLTAPRDELELVSLLWHKGSPWVEDIRRRLSGQLDAAEDRFLAAFDGGQMVACVWYSTARDDPKLGVIGHIYTHPQHRRRGLSARLMDAAMADFRARGGHVMQLFTSTPYTVPFYQRMGYENLHKNQSYHESDWYMRSPVGSAEAVAAWFEPAASRLRPLTDADLPQYCLLYNLEHQTLLKDWAQRIGLGLEAEFAFIHSLGKIQRGQGQCVVIDNGRTIVGAASLMVHDFPHQAHVAAFDFYMHPQFVDQAESLVDACLAHRSDLGIEIVYATGVDPQKRQALHRLGARSQVVLPRHYRVQERFCDCEMFLFKAR